ncbi:thioredoxin domain-containing protein [Brevundimonas sp.]|uniref:thioredoxin domain-containing protein n=1 Tax=Brevundimonas sp. TaxID=1871086 RepID=UPI003BACCBEB
MTLIRRLLLTLALALPLAGGAASIAMAADVPPVTAADRVIGRADAPVTVIEYASFTCPHCAHWFNEVLPVFKARFVDTGRVRLVFRNLPTSPAEVAMTAAGIARCAPADRYQAVARSLYEGQAAMLAGGQTWFSDAIAAGGMTGAQIETCFADPTVNRGLQSEIRAAQAAGVQGTPSFFVNGKLQRDGSIEALTTAIEAAAP